MDGNSDLRFETLLNYAWNYFEVHARQRMNLFNFFVGLAVLMTGTLVGTFHKEFTMPALGVVLGVGLTFISFVFWKLDQRVGYLIKNAEAALAELEGRFPADDSGAVPHRTQLVRCEASSTSKIRETRNRWSPLAQFSYARSFRLLFWFFGMIGVAGASLSLWRWVPS